MIMTAAEIIVDLSRNCDQRDPHQQHDDNKRNHHRTTTTVGGGTYDDQTLAHDDGKS